MWPPHAPQRQLGVRKITLRELLAECGATRCDPNYRQMLHEMLRGAVQAQLISPKSGMHWEWFANDPELCRIRQLVRQEVARKEARARANPDATQNMAASLPLPSSTLISKDSEALPWTAHSPGASSQLVAAHVPLLRTCSQLPDQAFSMDLAWGRGVQNGHHTRQTMPPKSRNQWRNPVDRHIPPQSMWTSAGLSSAETCLAFAIPELSPKSCISQGSLLEEKVPSHSRVQGPSSEHSIFTQTLEREISSGFITSNSSFPAIPLPYETKETVQEVDRDASAVPLQQQQIQLSFQPMQSVPQHILGDASSDLVHRPQTPMQERLGPKARPDAISKDLQRPLLQPSPHSMDTMHQQIVGQSDSGLSQPHESIMQSQALMQQQESSAARPGASADALHNPQTAKLQLHESSMLSQSRMLQQDVSATHADASADPLQFPQLKQSQVHDSNMQPHQQLQLYESSMPPQSLIQQQQSSATQPGTSADPFQNLQMQQLQLYESNMPPQSLIQQQQQQQSAATQLGASVDPLQNPQMQQLQLRDSSMPFKSLMFQQQSHVGQPGLPQQSWMQPGPQPLPANVDPSDNLQMPQFHVHQATTQHQSVMHKQQSILGKPGDQRIPHVANLPPFAQHAGDCQACRGSGKVHSCSEKARVDDQLSSLHVNKVKEKVKKTRIRRTSQTELRALKRKWMEAELADGEVKIRRDWEELPHDKVTWELLDRRYKVLGKGRNDECYDRVRSMLDSLIRQRSEELRTKQASLPEMDHPTALFQKLGLPNAQLPHPALLFLESDPNVTDADIGRAEEAVLDSLESYMSLDVLDRSLLWSIIAHRARLQDFNILQILASSKCITDADPTVAAQPPSSFEAFLLASGIAVQPNLEKRHKTLATEATNVDPVIILESEGAFLSLERKEHLHWFQQADHLDHVGPDSLFPSRANWTPGCEGGA